MGSILEYDAGNNILRVNVDGVVTDATVAEFYNASVAFVATHPACSGILDLTAVTRFDISSGGIRALAERPPAFPLGEGLVFVASRDYLYGIARMFQIASEDSRPNLRVVRTLEEAYTLLGAQTPKFGPVSLGAPKQEEAG